MLSVRLFVEIVLWWIVFQCTCHNKRMSVIERSERTTRADVSVQCAAELLCVFEFFVCEKRGGRQKRSTAHSKGGKAWTY